MENPYCSCKAMTGTDGLCGGGYVLDGAAVAGGQAELGRGQHRHHQPLVHRLVRVRPATRQLPLSLQLQ